MPVKKVFFLIFFLLGFIVNVQAQTEQKRAEELVGQYLFNKRKSTSNNTSIRFSGIRVLRSLFENTKLYKNLLHQVDSLKIEGKHIDARIAKMKTTAELNQAKKDSYRLSKELTVASDNLIDFIATYKGQQTGWYLKTGYPIKNKRGNFSSVKKTFYLNKELTQVDSAR